MLRSAEGTHVEKLYDFAPGEAHADFVIGDRDGTTSSPALSRLVCGHLAGLGYKVSYNHPYKGVELVRRYGQNASQRHSL